MVHVLPVYEMVLFAFDYTVTLYRVNSRLFNHMINGNVSFITDLLVTNNRVISAEKLKVQFP